MPSMPIFMSQMMGVKGCAKANAFLLMQKKLVKKYMWTCKHIHIHRRTKILGQFWCFNILIYVGFMYLNTEIVVSIYIDTGYIEMMLIR